MRLTEFVPPNQVVFVREGRVENFALGNLRCLGKDYGLDFELRFMVGLEFGSSFEALLIE